MAYNDLLGSTALTSPPGAAPSPQPAGPGPSVRPGLVAPAPAQEAQPNVSPEEQASYDELMSMVYQVAYNDIEATLKAALGAGDPAQGLGTTVGDIVSRVIDNANKEGKIFDQEVVLNVGAELLEDLADQMKEYDLHDMTEEQMETATYIAAERYRSLQQDKGTVDPNQAAASLENFQSAEAAGELENIAPGLEEKFGGAPTAPPAAGAGRGLVG